MRTGGAENPVARRGDSDRQGLGDGLAGLSRPCRVTEKAAVRTTAEKVPPRPRDLGNIWDSLQLGQSLSNLPIGKVVWTHMLYRDLEQVDPGSSALRLNSTPVMRTTSDGECRARGQERTPSPQHTRHDSESSKSPQICPSLANHRRSADSTFLIRAVQAASCELRTTATCRGLDLDGVLWAPRRLLLHVRTRHNATCS